MQAKQYSWQQPGLNVEAVPGAIRRAGGGGADATKPPSADTRTLEPAGDGLPRLRRDLVRMLAEGTFPDVGDVAMSRSSPRVGDGFIRLDVDGVVAYASPNALSAYHRMGLTSELEGHNLIEVTRPLISDPFEAQELAEHVQRLCWPAARACGWRSTPAVPQCCCGRCRWWCTAQRRAPRC